MAFCSKCGAQMPESGVCPNCNPDVSAPPPPPGYGAPPPPPPPGYGAPPPVYGQPMGYGGPPPVRGEEAIVRNPVTCILLSIVTCGIYYLYWLWVTHKQINDLAGAEIVSSGMLILGWFCPPVLWYVWYKWDNALQDVAVLYNIRYGANFILWIILCLFGVGSFVMTFQVQEALNQAYGG